MKNSNLIGNGNLSVPSTSRNSKHTSAPSDVQMSRASSVSVESRRLSVEGSSVSITDTLQAHRMSVDANFKFPKPHGIGRVLETIMAEESEIQALKDLEYERKVNAALEPHEMMIISPNPVQTSSTLPYSSSKLNPDNSYPSRLREEVRLSPLPQSSPQVNKRKLSLTDEKDLILFRPVKRILRAGSRPPHFQHTRTNSGSSVNSEMSVQAMLSDCGYRGFHIRSPRVQPLNLGGAGAEFGKMKLS